MNLTYQILIRFVFVYKKSLKPASKTGFWVENNLFNLCEHIVKITKVILVSQKNILNASILIIVPFLQFIQTF